MLSVIVGETKLGLQNKKFKVDWASLSLLGLLSLSVIFKEPTLHPGSKQGTSSSKKKRGRVCATIAKIYAKSGLNDCC